MFTNCFMAGSRPNYHGTLTFLDLSQCMLSDARGRQLGAMLVENTQLTHLDLEHNGFGPEGATALADALSRCCGLKALNMSQNEIDDKGVERLAEALRTISALQSLRLSDVGMDSASGAALARVLPGSGSALTVLDLSGASFDETPDALLEAIGALTALRHLDLSSQGCTSFVSLEGLVSCSALTRLDLCNLDMHRVRAADLARVLPRLPLLTHLDLAGNDFTSAESDCDCMPSRFHPAPAPCKGCVHNADAANRLASALGLCTALEELDVSGAHVPLADMDLRTCSRLRVLRVSCCDVSGAAGGMAAMTAWLPDLRRLWHLELARASVGDAEATLLASALQRCHSLQCLDLRENKIRDEGAAAIARVLSRLTALTVLDLEANKIGDEGGVSLAGAVGASSKLESLSVNDNPMGHGFIAVLHQLVGDEEEDAA